MYITGREIFEPVRSEDGQCDYGYAVFRGHVLLCTEGKCGRHYGKRKRIRTYGGEACRVAGLLGRRYVFIDDSRLVYQNEEKELLVFDAKTGETEKPELPGSAYNYYLSEDRTRIAVSGYNYLRIIDAEDYTEVQNLDEYCKEQTGRIYFNEDSTAVVLTLRNSDDVMSEDRRLLYLGLTDDTKRYSDWKTAYVEDVAFKDGCMYVLTYENRDELYSVFDSYLEEYEESTGKLLYRKEYKNAMLNDILFSRGDDDSMLLYGSYEADAVSRKTARFTCAPRRASAALYMRRR